ncbi:hypothetical protein DPMN_148784 [Dreissena polymorpha]|uniref:Uncharacterized protein n=1 Tax=Dreissena polymorpha TaxID=45954 RepID=A0A9D4FES2_DREPO|nr:hypothetical protein DPMN_148784 [Dreissena polymorpha]
MGLPNHKQKFTDDSRIGWQPLQARRQTSNVTMMYRIINNLLDFWPTPPSALLYHQQEAAVLETSYHTAELTISNTPSFRQQQDCGTNFLTTL